MADEKDVSHFVAAGLYLLRFLHIFPEVSLATSYIDHPNAQLLVPLSEPGVGYCIFRDIGPSRCAKVLVYTNKPHKENLAWPFRPYVC